MHADQLTVSPAMVRELVDSQFPRWRDLSVTVVESPGTVNAIFRIGDRLAARFPLRLDDAATVRRRLESEATAARELAGRTRFATPEPVAIGSPGAGYPLPWAVQTWLSGDTAEEVDPGASVAFAHDLAEFIAGVRAIDTRGRTFSGPGRGGDLRSHDSWMRTCFERSEHLLDVPRLRRLWEAMRALPRAAGDVMSHCDLIPGNVLVSGGRLTGILDVGDLAPADPALDLVAAWHLLEALPRQALRDDLQCDDLEWERGQAWAFQQAMGLVWYYADSNPAMSELGRRTLERIQAARPESSEPPESAGSAGSAGEEVTEAALRRAAALAAGDVAALRQLMHPGLQWTTYRGEVLGYEDYIAGNTRGSLRWRAQRLEDIAVVVADDTAVLTAAVTDEVCVDGRERSFRLRLTQTWVRTPAGWRCLAGHASLP
jgi:aminoglycoside phosphotransferase (APT) family kinase protein